MIALQLMAQLALSQVVSLEVPTEPSQVEGAIVGRVCLDANADGRCQAEEAGVAGVRVVLETGQYAVTDANGRYHLAALRARSADGLAGGRLQQGRHRLAIDARGLPSGTKIEQPSRTVELSMGALSMQDFAVAGRAETEAPARLEYEKLPPRGTLKEQTVLFVATGQAAKGSRVKAGGVDATVEADGSWKAEIPLVEGPNEVPVTVEARSGRVELYVQRFDVVARPQSTLVIPRAIEPTVTVTLPGTLEDAAAAGKTSLRVEGLPGTRVKGPTGDVVIGPTGAAQLPVTLSPGENAVQVVFERPGQPVRTQRLNMVAEQKAFVVGLIDVEATYAPQTRSFRVFGSGGMHAEVRRGPFMLEGELELRDTDLEAVQAGSATTLLNPRRVDRLERWLDPERYPTQWGDDSVSVVPNSAEGRLRLEATHERFGGVGFGTNRVLMQDAEVGRYHRLLFGPWARVQSPALGPVKLGAKGFYAPGLIDPLRGLATSAAHDELRATGGSLYYLGQPFVIEGSEVVRVEFRDGVTGLPLGEQRLVRARDYDIDTRSGRILLARPLSFVDGSGLFGTQPYGSSVDRVLVVDYEVARLAQGGRRTAGGEATADIGPATVAFGAVQEAGAGENRFELLRARATAPLGAMTFMLEGAQSRGVAVGRSLFGISSDGGLSYRRPTAATLSTGQALTARMRGKALFGLGRVDAAVRYRTAGFSDTSHFDEAGERRLTLIVEQPVPTHFKVGVVADDRRVLGAPGAFVTSATEYSVRDARTVGGYVGFHAGRFDARAEAKTQSLEVEQRGALLEGSRLGIGAHVRYQLLDSLALLATHHQALARSGEGPGAFDDTLTTAGAEVAVSDSADVGLRAGWGPALGPVAFATGQLRQGGTTHYASYAVDVDGPTIGEHRMVSGARSEVYDSGAVFVEDVAAHESTGLRLSRATGFTATVTDGMQLSARYERGMRQPFGSDDVRVRDAGGLSASFVRERIKLFARAELRSERAPTQAVRTTQRVASAAADVALTHSVHWSGRMHFADTYVGSARDSRLLEATTGVSFRGEVATVILQNSYQREQLPRSRTGAGERGFNAVSLLPSLRLSRRFGLAMGMHAGQSFEAGQSAFVLSGSLRPSVKVVGGLEVAAEVAGRTSAPDGGQLHAVRGELGYRFNEALLMAAGYTLLGFEGIGLSFDRANRDRVYLRAEVGF